MSTPTIAQIEERRDQLRGLVENVDQKPFVGQMFGPELEYDYKAVIGGIEALLTDVSALINNSTRFIKISNANERSQIKSYLEAMVVHFNNTPILVEQLDALKVIIRQFGIRNTKDRQVEFELEIEKIGRKKIELEEIIIELKAKIEIQDEQIQKLDEYSEKLDTLQENLGISIHENEDKRNQLIQESEKLNGINVSLSQLLEEGQETQREIVETLNEAKSNEKLIASFANNVQEKENQLAKVTADINGLATKLEEYETERKLLLEEANDLIESARQALGYKTAEGLSAAFQEQHNEAKKPNKLIPWMVGAIFFLLGAVGIGIWIILYNPNNVGLLFGRIALTSLPIAAAIFCARQYVKQKNIIEDYAYKMVIAKAMVGFSEELLQNNTHDEYTTYIQKVITEIHRDPMRSRKRDRMEFGSTELERRLRDLGDKFDELSKKIPKD